MQIGQGRYMKYKYPAAVYLCITLLILSVPAKSEQISDHYSPGETPSLTASLTATGSSTQGSSKTGGQTAFNLLDSVWILGFAISGLVLLRKVQGE
jgi:hypothetical protein